MSVWIPDGVAVFQVWPNECFICKYLNVCVTPTKVSAQEPQGPVCLGNDATHVCVFHPVSAEMLTPKYLWDGSVSRVVVWSL